MRGYDKIVVLDDQIVNRNRRQIQLQGLPMRAGIEGNPDSGFGAGVEQSFPLGVLAYRVNIRPVWNSGGNGGPRLAVVRGLVDVGFEVIELVPIDGGICG